MAIEISFKKVCFSPDLKRLRDSKDERLTRSLFIRKCMCSKCFLGIVWFNQFQCFVWWNASFSHFRIERAALYVEGSSPWSTLRVMIEHEFIQNAPFMSMYITSGYASTFPILWGKGMVFKSSRRPRNLKKGWFLQSYISELENKGIFLSLPQRLVHNRFYQTCFMALKGNKRPVYCCTLLHSLSA